jgi:arylsulfatase A-like enzyme
VLILVDDMRLEDMRAVPAAANRIGNQGATLANAYAPFPLCGPARATLLKGQYAHNHGVICNKAPKGGWQTLMAAQNETLFTWLDPTYRTGLFGKVINGFRWTDRLAGVDEYAGALSTYNYIYDRWGTWAEGKPNAARTIPGYSTDTIAALSADFIERSAASDEPYFLYSSIVAPHSGTPADPDDPAGIPSPYVKPVYRDTYSGQRNPNPAFNEADVSDKPLRPAPLTAEQQAGQHEHYQQRLESLTSVDDAVNTIVNAVEASGESQDTVIWFISDNGMLLGEHRIRGGKIAPYEVSNHIPMLVRWPGHIPAGSVIRDEVSQVNYAPTVLDAANVAPGVPQDAHSILPQLTGGTSPHPPIVLEGADASTGEWKYRGLLHDRWKYVKRTGGAEELYDLRNDPYELTNLARVSAYAGKRTEMAALATRYRDCAGAACRALP